MFLCEVKKPGSDGESLPGSLPRVGSLVVVTASGTVPEQYDGNQAATEHVLRFRQLNHAATGTVRAPDDLYRVMLAGRCCDFVAVRLQHCLRSLYRGVFLVRHFFGPLFSKNLARACPRVYFLQ